MACIAGQEEKGSERLSPKIFLHLGIAFSFSQNYSNPFEMIELKDDFQGRDLGLVIQGKYFGATNKF